MAIIRKFFNFRWQHNDSTVYVDSTAPRIFQKEVGIRPTIVIDLKDKQFGVDPASIELYLEGFDITSAATISAITDGYRIVYVPTIDFAHDQTVSLLVRVANIHGFYTPDYSYFFITKRKRLYELVVEAVKEIAEEVDWDDVKDDRF
jgi:hypothetical protein